MTVGLTDLPLYALQRVADQWLVWAPDADPRMPAVRIVAAFDAEHGPQRSQLVNRRLILQKLPDRQSGFDKTRMRGSFA
jgi:hypothetical protein